jgi:hypothetical protein
LKILTLIEFSYIHIYFHNINLSDRVKTYLVEYIFHEKNSFILAARLIPIDVDLHTKKNMEEHSTSHYDIPGLVLRRGQPFSFTVTFNRDFDVEQHQLYVRLAIGIFIR